MTVTAEVPLVVSAIALALVALLVSFPGPATRPRRAIAPAIAAIGVALPLGLYVFSTPGIAENALWEWSAAGGPTVQASYRYDGIAAIGVALSVAYGSAGLFAVSRASSRRALLPGLVLAIAFVSIALHVTADLIAGVVVLGFIGSLSAVAMIFVAPAPASARLATFVAIGVQLFVVAGLLVARFGGGSFRYDDIAATWISPGVIVAASLGAALFAGLYPFVPWRFERLGGNADLEPLRGLLAMPIGIGASFVLLRLLGATRGDLATVGLPAIQPNLRALVVMLVALGLGMLVRRGPLRRPAVLTGGLALVALLAYPWLHWSHAVLFCALLTVLYAAAVSLTFPDEWDVVRYDVALAGLWAAMALGSPAAIAGGLALVVAEGTVALFESIWMPPHRAQIAAVTTSSALIAAALGLGFGVLTSPDLATQLLAIAVLLPLLGLELIHIGRRLGVADVPAELDLTAAAAAFLGTLLTAMLIAGPVLDALADQARPLSLQGASPALIPALAASATVLVLVARAVTPLLPDLRQMTAGLRALVALADPVPAGVTAFRGLERAVAAASLTFRLFERQAGVWLAALLIVGLLAWATGPT